MVRPSPGPPNRISSCATNPGSRTLWICTPPGARAPRAPSMIVDSVGSRHSSRPAAARAAAMRSAVLIEVPDGASRFAA